MTVTATGVLSAAVIQPVGTNKSENSFHNSISDYQGFNDTDKCISGSPLFKKRMPVGVNATHETSSLSRLKYSQYFTKQKGKKLRSAIYMKQ